MLSIDEAIEDFKTMAKDARGEIIHGDNLEPQERYYNSQIELCAKEKEQLAEWLEALKDYRDKNKMVVRIDVENMDSVKDKIEELLKYAESQYNKAIDDFIHECDKYCGFYSGKNKSITREDILKIAEQLKAKNNERRSDGE